MSTYKITKYSYAKASNHGVTIKPSTNPKKKIDVYNKAGQKIASIGAVGYLDYPNYIKKIGRAEAMKKRKAYLARHAHDPKIKDGKKTNSFWADVILW